MMSNKWAFSLTSLITILALAFVVADNAFGTEITVQDVSIADGTQIEYAVNATFTVKLDKPVALNEAPATVFAVAKNGVLTAVTIDASNRRLKSADGMTTSRSASLSRLPM